jgi:hypothetical protein
MNARAPIPELTKHLRAIDEGNRRDREWMAEERFDEIVRLIEIVSSHLICAREAGRRGDEGLLGYHMSAAWDDLQSARREFKALPSHANEGGHD